MMSSCAALAIVYCAILGQAQATVSNAEHLEEYARAFEGDWISEWEMDITIPEVVEKGDKVVVRATTKWILNKNALETTWEADVNGKLAGSGKGAIGWDRATKEIVSCGFDSFGGRGDSVLTKVGSRWIELGMGVGNDGKKFVINNVTTFSDDGNTQTTEMTGRLSPNGVPIPNFTTVSTRTKTRD